MCIPSLDLSSVSYPKPTPPNFSEYGHSPWSCEQATKAYQKELAVWTKHQNQIQAKAQELTAQQQKMNEAHANLLEQYKKIQEQLLAEVAAHTKETQDIKKLEADMATITRVLHEILSKNKGETQ
jgi:predicted  nucleic acid-binding Zn-ribbon protein